jgi:D-serine deaminase-like pyridoxal phosphate-dependent protein
VGGNRCGVQPGSEAVELARAIAASPNLRFGGLQAYHGRAQHLRTPEERRDAIGATIEATRRTVELLRQQGLDCTIVGGAGTGTFQHEAASGVFNELQAGSYVFLDADYGRNLDADGKPVSTFRHSLFVLATVISAAVPGRAVVDAGHKAVAVDSGLPLVWQRPDMRYVSASDEHGKIEFGAETAAPAIGEKLRLVPGHCDPTVDKYDWYVGVRGGRVECLWPITARGGLS